MPKCSTCGNEYDHAMEVLYEGQKYYFDSFECAIHKLAPSCEHCGCKIIGHGVDHDGRWFCCEHCARQVGSHVQKALRV